MFDFLSGLVNLLKDSQSPILISIQTCRFPTTRSSREGAPIKIAQAIFIQFVFILTKISLSRILHI